MQSLQNQINASGTGKKKSLEKWKNIYVGGCRSRDMGMTFTDTFEKEDVLQGRDTKKIIL